MKKICAVMKGNYETVCLGVFTDRKKAELFRDRENLLLDDNTDDAAWIKELPLNPDPRPFPKYVFITNEYYDISEGGITPESIFYYEAEEPCPIKLEIETVEGETLLTGFSGTVEVIKGETNEEMVARGLRIVKEKFKEYVNRKRGRE